MMKQLFLTVLLCVSGISLAACGRKLPGGPGGIDGYVYVLDENARTMTADRTLLKDLEDATFTAASGATVALNTGQSAVSGENGFFSFPGLDPGNYIVTITYASYNPLEVSVRVSAGATTHVNQRIPAPEKAWNFLVYLDGDNDLEPFAIQDINEMEQIGSGSNVNVLVLIDRIAGYDLSNGDWTGARLYCVKQDADTSTINSYLMEDLGERDMSDPDTLKDFIIYCQKYFPARHTVLTLWNHGGGVYPRTASQQDLIVKGSAKKKFKPKKANAVKGICWDDTAGGDCLTTDEVAKALSDARSVTGKKIDIINMDACLMQMLEVAYEWRYEADYLAGSEETVPGAGNSYNVLLGHLTGNPSQTAEDFAVTLVDDYNYYYSSTNNTTYSALRLGEYLDSFIGDFKTMAAALKSTSDYAGAHNAFNATTCFAYAENRDLYDFCQELSVRSTDIAVTSAAGNLISSFSSMVIHYHNTIPYSSSSPAYGIAVLLPGDSAVWSIYSSEYPRLKLSADTEWDEFISGFISRTEKQSKTIENFS
ncbi:MAG: clostripain-related cysteine peptidase [Bacillota bacterium]